MSNLQQRGFLRITKTRKAREVLISKGGGGRGEIGGEGGNEGEGGGEGEGGVEGKGKLIIRCIFCSQIDRPITKGLIRGGLQHPLPLLPLKNFCFNLHEAASL